MSDRVKAMTCQVEAIVDHLLDEGYSTQTLHEILDALRRGQERIEANLVMRKSPRWTGGAA
jgi:hypothetical protein